MNIESILAPSRTVCALEAASKKRAIERAAEIIAESMPGINVGALYRGLLERERLGSTAIGHGVAIPHCRLRDCDKIIGALFTLSDPVDFSAPDDEPVSIMFVLLVPENETDHHLAALAMLAERFEQRSYRSALTSAGSNNELFERALALPRESQPSGTS
jgi:PTS system nitrogen regulatory IIA component